MIIISFMIGPKGQQNRSKRQMYDIGKEDKSNHRYKIFIRRLNEQSACS